MIDEKEDGRMPSCMNISNNNNIIDDDVMEKRMCTKKTLNDEKKYHDMASMMFFIRANDDGHIENMNTNRHIPHLTNILPTHQDVERADKKSDEEEEGEQNRKNNAIILGKNTISSMPMSQQGKYIPLPLLPPLHSNRVDMSTTTFNITSTTTMITSHKYDNRDEQYTVVALNSNERTVMKTANVDDGRENQRDREKGEREHREDDVERTLTMREQARERVKQTSTNTDSVTSFTTEQYNCPSVNDSMINRVSSSFNSNNNYQNISLSNTPSTHTTNSMNHHFREYEPSYPSIPRYRTSLSSSPYRKTYYLDDSDEEIIKEEIIEITDLDHYPTLIERWGDDTKTIVTQQGDFKIEDYVEFEETEPTITEEISYEIIYSGDQIQSTREIYHSRSESRNFRKLKKRRTKRKRTTQSIKINSIIQTHEQVTNLDDDLSDDNIAENSIIKETYQIIPSVLNGNRSPLQILKSDEQKIDLLFNESHIPFDDHTKVSEQKTQVEGQPSKTEIIETPIEFITIKYEPMLSSIDENIESNRPSLTTIDGYSADQDLQPFLNSLLSYLIPDVFDVDSISSDQLKNERITIDKQAISTKDETKDNLNDPIHEILTTSLPLHDSSTYHASETTVHIEKPFADAIDQTNQSPKSSNNLTVNENQQKTTSEDEAESLSYNAITEAARELLAVSTPHQLPSADVQTEKSSIDSCIERTSTVETIVPSNSPAIFTTIYPSPAEIKIESTDAEDQDDKKPVTDLTITSEEDLSQTVDAREQSSIPSHIKDDQTIELSSDFLADIVRQIINTTVTPHLSSEKQIVDISTTDSLIDIIEQTSITSIITTNNELLESNKTVPTTDSVQDTIFEAEAERLSSNAVIEAVHEVRTAPLVKDTIETTLVSTDVKLSSDSLIEIVHQIQNYLPNQSKTSSSISKDKSIPLSLSILNSFNQITNEPSYSTSELTNIMNSILYPPMKMLSKERTDIPQQSEISEHQYFPFTINEPTSSDYIPTDNEQSDKRIISPDFTQIYYELQEQRQIQPLMNATQIEQKEEVLNVHNEHFDLKSLSLISNLPSREYRQVFGIPDEVVNTIDDLTYYIDQTLPSVGSDEVKSMTLDSNENTQIVEIIEDHQSVISPAQKELINKTPSSSISNVELDFRYTLLLDRINTLTKPLTDLPSSSSTTENELISSKNKEEKDDHVNRLEEATNVNLIINTTTTESQNEETIIISPDQLTTESNINSNQQEDVANTYASNVIEYTTSLISDVVSNITSNLPLIATNEETTLTLSPSKETVTKIENKQQQQQETSSSTDQIPTIVEHQELANSSNVVDIASSFITTVISNLTSALSKSSEDIETKEDDEQQQLSSTLLSKTSTETTSQESPQTLTEKVKEVADNTNEEIVPTQEQVTQTSIHQPSIIEEKQQDEFGKQSLFHELQVINDDYPWYSSYYTIVDAETKIARLHKQLNLVNEQLSSPTTDKSQTEIQDEDKLHITENESSSTVHEEILPSTIITTDSTLTKNLDLEQIILYEYPEIVITTSPIVPQTMNATNKKKHKKKKKDKKEVIVSDTSEPKPWNINTQKMETIQSHIVEEHQENKQKFEQLHPVSTILPGDQKPETVSASIISSTEELEQIDDKKNESTVSDTSQLLSTPVTVQTIESQPTILQSSIKEITKTGPTKVNTLPSKEKEEEDNEGFQLVHYRKGILMGTKPKKLASSSTTTSKDIPRSDTDQKILVTQDNESSPTSTTAVTQSTTSKKKRNKHKKHKKETVSTSNIDWTKIEQQPIEQESILQSQVSSSSSVDENSNVQSKSNLQPTIKTTTIPTTLTASPGEEEEEEDNEGFQVVRYRRRITSPPRSETTIPPSSSSSSSSTKNTYKQNVSRTMGLTPVVLYGRRGSASRSTPRPTTNIGTSNKNQQVRPKQDKKQTSLLRTLSRSTSIDADNNSKTPKDNKQEIEQQQSKHYKRETNLDVKSEVERSTKPTDKDYHASAKNEAKTVNQQSPTDEIIPPIELNAASTVTKSPTSTKTDDQIDTFTEIFQQPTSPEKSFEKSKTNIDDLPSPLTTDINFVPLSVEETTDRKAPDNIQHVPEPQIVTTSNSSTSEEVTSISITDKTSTAQINEPVHQTYGTQSSLHLSTTEQTEQVITKENLSSPSIESIKNTEDEQINLTSNKKAVKRRKKKSNTKEKPDNKNSSTITSAASNDNKQEPEKTTTSPSNTSETLLTKELKSQPSTINRLIESVPLSSTNIDSVNVLPSLPSQSTHFTENTNSKLDLFLPEYIRQQINTCSTSSSNNPIITPTTTTITSSDTIQKKKQRPKMLNKDYEAKSLLTNEFDSITPIDESHKQETVSTDDDTINDDDEFIVQTVDSTQSDKPEENIENILSRGFYLWLQESQALSKQPTKSSSSNNLTHAMQSIVIQPLESNDDDDDEEEDSWNTFEAMKPIFMMGTRIEKRIHITNAYFINHPESSLTPSWLRTPSNDNTFQDDSKKSDSKDKEDSSKGHTSHSTNTQSDSNNTNQQTSFTTDDVQQCLGENFYHQLNNTNHSINFDDWAYFFERRNSYHIEQDLSPSLECFYTRTFDDDTLLSNTLPIHHSINQEKQRYGDFLLPNNDMIISESKISFSSYKFKPSEYFQNCRKQESSYEGDDEIFITYSNNGLSRRIEP